MSIMLVFMISFSSIYVYASDEEENGGSGSDGGEIAWEAYENEGETFPSDDNSVDQTTLYNFKKLFLQILDQAAILPDPNNPLDMLATDFIIACSKQSGVDPIRCMKVFVLALYQQGYIYKAADGRVHFGTPSGPSQHSNSHYSDLNSDISTYNDFVQNVAMRVRYGLDSVPVVYQASTLQQYYAKWGRMQSYYNNGSGDPAEAAQTFVNWLKTYIEYDPDTGVYTLLLVPAVNSISTNIAVTDAVKGLQEFPFEVTGKMLKIKDSYYFSYDEFPDQWFLSHIKNPDYYSGPLICGFYPSRVADGKCNTDLSRSDDFIFLSSDYGDNSNSWYAFTQKFCTAIFEDDSIILSDFVDNTYSFKWSGLRDKNNRCDADNPKNIWYDNGLPYYSIICGNAIMYYGNHVYMFYHGGFYDLGIQSGVLNTHVISLSDTDGNIVNINNNTFQKNYTDIDLEKLIDLNVKLFDDINNNFSLTLEDLWKLFDELSIKIQNGLSEGKDYEDLLNELKEYLLHMNEKLDDIDGSLEGIAGGIGDIIYYLKKIDTKCKNIDKKIDTFLSSWNPFTVLFENKMNELIAAVSGNGGTASGNSIVNNNGDVITNTYNLLFTMNEEQQNDIDIEINKIKAPLNWAFDFSDNASDFLNKFENRAAMYSSGNRIGSKNIFNKYNSASSNGVNNDNDIEPETEISADAGNGGGIRDDAGIPCIYMDFSNATSDIDYGGKVKVLKFDWYMPYKPYVDYVIVIFCWAFALWKIWKALPSIISGVSSAIDNSDK